MKRTLSAIAALTCALHAPALAQTSQTLLQNASVIDVESGNVTRGQNVLVEEPSVEDSISILRGIKERYEVHHGVRITDGALVSAAELNCLTDNRSAT